MLRRFLHSRLLMRAMILLLVGFAACAEIETPRTDTATLNFAAALGEPDPSAQTLRVEVGSSQVWAIQTSADWINVSPDSGRGPATITVSIRPLLLVGDISDTIRITSERRVHEVPVQLHRTGKPARGLLYSIPHAVNPPGRDSIFVAGPDGSAGRPIRFSYDNPQSPDAVLPRSGAVFDASGGRIAFVGLLNCCSAGGRVFTSNADGTAAGSLPDYGECRFAYAGGVTWSPAGDALAWSCVDQSAWLLVNGRPPLRVPAAATPAWSPDGTWIAIATRLVSADRSRPDTLFQVQNQLHPLSAIGWAPDGRLLLAGGCGTGVFVIPRVAALVPGATPAPLLGPEYSYATFSPDGKKLLAVRCSPSLAVEMMEANGTNVTWTMPGANWAAWRP